VKGGSTLQDVEPSFQPSVNKFPFAIPPLLIRVVSVCGLLWVAVFNGYPIVFSDSGSYLLTGDMLVALWPFRSPGYSVFTRFASLGISGWFVVGLQAILVVYVLDQTCAYLLGDERRFHGICMLASVCILAVLTSLPWLVSQLMPDVFAGIVFLSSFLLAFNDQLRLARRTLLAAILLISSAAHASLLPIAAVFVSALIVVRLVRRPHGPPAVRKAVLVSLFVPLIASGLSTATLNYRMHLGFKVSPSGQLFVMSRLFADGLAADFLRDNCPKLPFLACRYLSDLPRTQTEFLFGDSPLLGELTGHPQEMDEIVRGTLASYKLRFLASSAKETILQLAAIRTGDEVRSFNAKEWNINALGQVFPGDCRAFFRSKQSRGLLLPLANTAAAIHTAIFWLSLASCFTFACTKSRRRLNHFFFSAMAFLLINAAVCATFSGVFDRYQSRVAWLAALCATIYVCSWFQDRHRAKSLARGF
jgi:hypothetical protein